MKKITLLLSTLVLSTLAYSQDSTVTKKDTTKIKFGKSSILILNRTFDNDYYDYDFTKCDSSAHKDKKEWVTVTMDLGVNGYMAPDLNLSLPASQSLMEIDYARSRSFAVYMSLKGADLIKNRLYVAPGLGIARNNYAFKNSIQISTSNNATVFNADSVIDYDKFKLRTTYLEVPLVIGARIGNLENPLGIQLGVIGGFNIGSMIKQKYTLDATNYKVKIKDDFNINPFKFDAIARLTIGNIGLFARYSMTTFFEKNKAPELYPFSVGFTVGEF